MVLHIDPKNYKEEMLQYIVAHQYHHNVLSMNDQMDSIDLMDYVIFKGKADAFAKIISPNIEIPWTRELNSEDEEKIWSWVKERIDTFDSKDIIDLRFGNDHLYYWSDTRLGNQIMQNFIENNPNISPVEWTYMSTDEILNKTDFANK